MARQVQPRAGSPLRWGDSLTQGLRLYLPFTEGSGRSLANLAAGSSGGIDQSPPSGARFVGTPTWTTGPHGPALSFPGSGNNYLSVNPLRFPSGSAASAAAWVKVAAGQNPAFFGNSTTVAANVFRVYPAYGDNKFYWEYGGSSGSGALSFNFDTSLYGKWFHFAVVSGGSRGNYRAIYINGVLAASASASASPGTVTTFFTIGAYDLGRWAGEASNFAIWDRQLSAGDVQRLYRDPWCMVGNFPIAIRSYQAPVTSFSGTSAVTAPAATLTASGTIVNAYTGSSAVTAAAATLAASGTVVNPAANTGRLMLLGIG